jgi:hypothetical protein
VAIPVVKDYMPKAAPPPEPKARTGINRALLIQAYGALPEEILEAVKDQSFDDPAKSPADRVTIARVFNDYLVRDFLKSSGGAFGGKPRLEFESALDALAKSPWWKPIIDAYSARKRGHLKDADELMVARALRPLAEQFMRKAVRDQGGVAPEVALSPAWFNLAQKPSPARARAFNDRVYGILAGRQDFQDFLQNRFRGSDTASLQWKQWLENYFNSRFTAVDDKTAVQIAVAMKQLVDMFLATP